MATTGIAAVGVAILGAPLARAAGLALRQRRFDVALLMLVATVGALALGELGEAVALVALWRLADTVEARVRARARGAAQSLRAVRPDRARRLSADGGWQDVPLSALAPGDRVIVAAGARVPADGIVRRGRSTVSTAVLTGESMPEAIAPGDRIWAGALNGPGELEVEVTQPAGRSLLDRIVEWMEATPRAPLRPWSARFFALYTPAVLAGAAVVALFSWATGTPELAVRRALAWLVAGCPCALVIAGPLIRAATAAALARRGVAVRSGAALEALADVRVVAFDKTGTLTRGRPEVVDVVPLCAEPQEAVLAAAAALEQHVAHPLADALVDGARRAATTLPVADAVEAHPGLGVHGRIAGRPVWVGRHEWLTQQGLAGAAPDARCAHTTVWVGGECTHGRRVWGRICVADRPRREALAALRALRQLGIRRIELLTGDRPEAAAAAAAAFGSSVDAVHAGLDPLQKVAHVQRLAQDGPVLFLGDGWNDAPALRAAHLGAAMGLRGADAAVAHADLVLLRDELTALPRALRAARRARRLLRGACALALGAKAGVLLWASAGAPPLWIAVAADTGTTLAVALLSLLALRRP